MALFKPTIAGDISGKLGGLVFSHNRFGAYMRSYVVPVNPNTPQQVQNRGFFTSAASAWHALTEAQKGNFNMFGETYFDPKSGKVGGYTGYNAFVAMRSAALAGNAKYQTTTISLPAGATATYANFYPSTLPAAFAVSNNILSSTSVPIAQTLTSASLTAAGACMIEITFDEVQAAAPVWQDSVCLVPVGYSVMASLGAHQANNYKLKDRITLGTIKPPTVTGWTSSDKIKFNFTMSAARIAMLKNWYTVPDCIRINVYTLSIWGQQKLIGGVDCDVS